MTTGGADGPGGPTGRMADDGSDPPATPPGSATASGLGLGLGLGSHPAPSPPASPPPAPPPPAPPPPLGPPADLAVFPPDRNRPGVTDPGVVVATWNVNSLRKRLPQVLHLLERRRIDVLCLQEIKATEAEVPVQALARAGLAHHALAVMPGYNGVGIFSRVPLDGIDRIDWCGRGDCRHVQARVGDLEIHSLYIPAGGDLPDPARNPRFQHKLAFLDELTAWAETAITANRPVLIAGDFNIAPLDSDVWDTRKLRRVVTHTPVERAALARLQAAGPFVDAMRTLVPPPAPMFTWWSYRTRDWRSHNRGRRLDHVWITPGLVDRLRGLEVLVDLREGGTPSDHVPVLVTLTAPPR